MRTTVEIRGDLLNEAMIITGAKKKRECIELALQEVIRQRRIERLIQRLGKTRLSMTLEDLQQMREDADIIA